MEHISKSQIKYIKGLQIKKNRDEHCVFVAEGEKCISELLKRYSADLLVSSVPTMLPVTHSATEEELSQMSSLRTPQGVLGVFKMPSHELCKIDEKLVVVLDGVQDPGNLGTIIRTCDWFGVHDVVCSKTTADCFNPKVIQSTMGSLARVRVYYTDIVTWLHQQDCPIYGTLLDGEDMYEVLTTSRIKSEHTRVIVVMGNEGNGLSTAVRQCVTHAVRIPSYPDGAETCESLNVSIATAIILSTFRHLS